MNNFKAIILALTAISAATAVRADSLECPVFCPDSYAPVCASDGKEYAQFDNDCSLKAFNCKRQRAILPAYKEIDIDWCRTTELHELDSDFSVDMDEADNSCLLPCPMIYSPLCASNGTYRKVFSNECEIKMYNCLIKNKTTKQNWRILKQGSCSLYTEEEW